MNRQRAFVVGVAVLSLFAIIGVVALALNPFGDDASAANPETCSSRRTAPEVAQCLDGYFREAAKDDRVDATLQELDGLIRRGVLDDCHFVAHAFGHVAFAEIRNLDRALVAGSSECSNGYQHGVVEAAVGGAGRPAGALHTGDAATCAAQLTLELLDGCVHGLGHAFMYETGHDVGRSLARCDARLPDPEHADRCRGGVMMENAMQHMQLGAAGFRERVRSACDGLRLGRELLRLCYSQIGEVSMFFFRHDIARVTPLCRRIETRFGSGACLDGAREELRWVRSQRA